MWVRPSTKGSSPDIVASTWLSSTSPLTTSMGSLVVDLVSLGLALLRSFPGRFWGELLPGRLFGVERGPPVGAPGPPWGPRPPGVRKELPARRPNAPPTGAPSRRDPAPGPLLPMGGSEQLAVHSAVRHRAEVLLGQRPVRPAACERFAALSSAAGLGSFADLA